jgi:hypothetical protein
MKSSELINVNQCCDLLKISRPTFNKQSKSLQLSGIQKGRSTYYKKIEILNRIYVHAFNVQETIDLVLINQSFDISDILVDEFTMDLRKINRIDPYGIISLLCYVSAKVKGGSNFFFVTHNSKVEVLLAATGFFKELKRKYPNLIHWNSHIINKLEPSVHMLEKIFLPLKEITLRGQDRQVLNDLLSSLLKKGFSEAQAGYIGWIIGELADNSLTHAKGPCYIMFSRYNNNSQTVLEIAVGDIGIGIHKSLQTNNKYAALNDKQAFLKSFQSQVSCWPDSAQRGKGLCDLLTIALGNGGYVKVDANELGLFFNFTNSQRYLEFNEPLTEISGTRFSIILFEKEFKSTNRSEIDSFINLEIVKYV